MSVTVISMEIGESKGNRERKTRGGEEMRRDAMDFPD
jgi:hypothetical protein